MTPLRAPLDRGRALRGWRRALLRRVQAGCDLGTAWLAPLQSAPWRLVACPCSGKPTADEQLDAAYEEVKSVTSIGRGVGAWGDMVVSLNDGSKIEMRSLPR